MVLEIGGYKDSIYLENNKSYTKEEIKEMYNDVLSKDDSREQPIVADFFVKLYGFNLIEGLDGKLINTIIDTDVDYVYNIKY